MPRLTDEEREQRRKKVQQEALEAVATRGQFNFRLDGEDIKRLYELAGSRQKPVSAMVREWVLERLESELSGGQCPAPAWAKLLEKRINHTETIFLLAVCATSASNQTSSPLREKLLQHLNQHGDVDALQEMRELLI